MWGKGASLCALFLAGCQAVSPPQQVKNTNRTFTSVVVDAGHGGRDSGAYRRYGPPEKVVTLDVATRLSRKLRESQFNVVMRVSIVGDWAGRKAYRYYRCRLVDRERSRCGTIRIVIVVVRAGKMR